MSDGFLSRWSRRKRGELPEAAAPAPVPAPVPVLEPEFDVATLPDVATATAETDFTAFLQKGVPEFLKRQALRRAWTLDPGIRDFVGPADYAWDFNAVDGVPGFSLTLDGDIRKLLAQAIGQLDALTEEKPPSFLPPGAAPALDQPPEGPPPADPLRLAEAVPPPAIEPEMLVEPEPSPPRRHGTATPA